jgi:hypothetical protein
VERQKIFSKQQDKCRSIRTETNFLSMDDRMPSSPGPFCSSSPKMAFSTAVCVSWTRDILCDSCSSSGKVQSWATKWVHPHAHKHPESTPQTIPLHSFILFIAHTLVCLRDSFHKLLGLDLFIVEIVKLPVEPRILLVVITADQHQVGGR